MTTRRAPLRDRRRVEFGDWQTPDALAEQVLRLIAQGGAAPRSVLEPTCGVGAFLVAAAARFPKATLVGHDLSAEYVDATTERLPPGRSRVQVADFFEVDWAQVIERLPEPLLILGNPPWVTNSGLGTSSGSNLPPKANFKAQPGFESMLGSSNFDISEWMLIQLLEAAQARRFTLAMLCKGAVARRLMEYSASRGWRLTGSLHRVDARLHFGAAVDAVLLHLSPGKRSRDPVEPSWPVFPSLTATEAEHTLGMVAGRACNDVAAHRSTSALAGSSQLLWRSGIKHDCSKIMELELRAGVWTNQLNQVVEVEEEFRYPLLKGSDIANGRLEPRRAVIVTQRHLGEDTRALQTRAPRLWRYLDTHREMLAARKSKIYARQPAFAMFGVGAYSFAPFKVAICGLYKRLSFRVVSQLGGQPIMLDDTTYFLPCSSQAEANTLADALNSQLATEFFEARVFWEAKRPISKRLLQSISLDLLLRAHAAQGEHQSTGAAPDVQPGARFEPESSA